MIDMNKIVTSPLTQCMDENGCALFVFWGQYTYYLNLLINPIIQRIDNVHTLIYI